MWLKRLSQYMCIYIMYYVCMKACHIVQLAISQKKLLGYLNGSVVPYSRSQSMVIRDFKDLCTNHFEILRERYDVRGFVVCLRAMHVQ